MSRNKPLEPVKPNGMELIYFYQCPHCGRDVPLIAQTQPSMVQCDSCRGSFPIVPVDAHGIRYIKLMLANGAAGIDPDYI